LLIAMNIQTSLASIAILVFVAVLALIRPFPLASWFAMLAGSLTYAAISYSLFGLGATMLLTSGLAFAIYLVTSLWGTCLPPNRQSARPVRKRAYFDGRPGAVRPIDGIRAGSSPSSA
jgi:hypothetical protein